MKTLIATRKKLIDLVLMLNIEATFILIICVACFSVYGSELRQL